MPFDVLSCTDADMYPAFVLVSETFNHDQPYHDAIYPFHLTEAGRKDGATRFCNTKNHEPNVRFIKAVDSSTSDLAGLVRYYVYEQGLEESELEGDWWEDEEEKAYAKHLYKNYLTTHYATVKSVKGPVVCTRCFRPQLQIANLEVLVVADIVSGLELLTIHPKYQSHGAGTALVRWGINLATQIGAEVRRKRPLSCLVWKSRSYRQS